MLLDCDADVLVTFYCSTFFSTNTFKYNQLVWSSGLKGRGHWKGQKTGPYLESSLILHFLVNYLSFLIKWSLVGSLANKSRDVWHRTKVSQWIFHYLQKNKRIKIQDKRFFSRVKLAVKQGRFHTRAVVTLWCDSVLVWNAIRPRSAQRNTLLTRRCLEVLSKVPFCSIFAWYLAQMIAAIMLL